MGLPFVNAPLTIKRTGKEGLLMALTKWTPPRWGLRRLEPFREMEEMAEEMDRLFGEYGRRHPFLGGRGWLPAVDMIDRKDELLVKVELPGMEKDDIDIAVTGDLLTIKGEGKMEKEMKEDDYYCCESAYGSFSRTISLPVGVETGNVKAEYRNGILEVHLPKTKEVKERMKKIPIK